MFDVNLFLFSFFFFFFFWWTNNSKNIVQSYQHINDIIEKTRTEKDR